MQPRSGGPQSGFSGKACLNRCYGVLMGKKSSPGLPKTKCCVSKDKCGRCPLRMLKEGTLPDAYAVKKRRLVHADSMEPVRKDDLKKSRKVVVVSAGKATKSAKAATSAKAAKASKKAGRRGSRLATAA